MARVTNEQVKAIMSDIDVSDADIDIYISSANVMVTKNLASSALTDDVLLEIERWLTAHMISSTRERQTIEEQAGTAKVKYAGVYGEKLAMTSYGQMVLMLDSTGILASLGGKSVKMTAITSFE